MAENPLGLEQEVQGNMDLQKRLLDYSLKYYGLYRDSYEQYVHDWLTENYQLTLLYDALLVKRQREATRLIRGTVNIPKMQPELFARMAQETKILTGKAKPIWRVNPPRSADKETIKKVNRVEEFTNDLFDFDNWYWHWWSAKFWASLAPYCVIEESYSQEFSSVPTGDVNYGSKRLNFESRMSFCGPRTKVWFPWEFFFDITFPNIEPPCFTRYLMSDGELVEKLKSKEYVIPKGQTNEVRGGGSGLRNYGLEIVRSVPRKFGAGQGDNKRYLKDQHEILCCLGYMEDESGKRKLQRWWILNQRAVVKGPEDVTEKKTAVNYLLCSTRKVPGFGFGIPPGDSAKQIQRAVNQTFNGRHEALLFGLVPPFLIGDGQTFVDEKPVVAPATAIRMSGDVRNVQVLQSRVSPTEADSVLGYLDAKGYLATNVNPNVLGAYKEGTPPSAIETGAVGEAHDTILGMFMLTEKEFFIRWAQLKYWIAMEQCPVDMEINGKAYHLTDLIIGEPQFDLPQLGEAAGRTADELKIQAFVSSWAPFLATPGMTKDTNPQLFALMEKHALSLNQTWIDEVLEPAEEKAKIEPAGIPDETELYLQQVDAQRRQTEMAAAGQAQNGTKGAPTNGKKAER